LGRSTCTVTRSRSDSDYGFADGGGLLVAWLALHGERRPYASWQGEKWEAYAGRHPGSGKLGARLTRL